MEAQERGPHPCAAVEIIETGAGATRPFEMIQEVLRQAELEREQVESLAVGLGPGSYTGIRAAIAVAQGWQFARGIKLLGISSAEGIAAQARTEGLTGPVTIAIDAQREEFYITRFEIGPEQRRQVEPLRLATLTDVQERLQAGEVLIGPEVKRWFREGRPVFPRAGIIAQLAVSRTDFVRGEELKPIYLRQTSFVKAPPPRVIP